MFVSAEDELLAQHGTSLAARICKRAGPGSECLTDLSLELRQLQSATELLASQQRLHMLEHDLQRDSTLAKFLGESS
jgi:hypothetical protein